MEVQNQISKEFDRPPTKEELLSLYKKGEENDPASLHYKRHLVRPKLHIVRALLFCLLTFIFAAGIGIITHLAFHTLFISILAGIALIILVILVFLKRILVWLIRCYQRLAPEKIRNRCRFEPSCSDYMILSLQKWGVLRGVIRGIRRLLRCKPPFGGVDLP